MKEQWYMVLDEKTNVWRWCVLRGRMLAWGQRAFAQYAESYEDAARHGCSGVPAFARIAAPCPHLH
jgi:hypothetical protein